MSNFNFDDQDSRHSFGRPPFKASWFPFVQARRGDMRPIILNLLKERPMHGYEVIRALEEKSHGLWRPSPGSIYPTLQLLEEEELVVGQNDNGKKVYTLTDAGRVEAAKVETEHPWEQKGHHHERMHQFRDLAANLMASLKYLTFKGSDEQFAETKKILESTANQLTKLINQSKKESL